MVDVARHAGVSTQTVSRVVNRLQNVDPGTRDRVLESMAALGYRQNRAARALRLGRYRTIGIVLFDVGTSGNLRTLQAVANVTAQAGYSVTFVTIEHPDQAHVNAAFERMRAQEVDGVLIVIDQQVLDDTGMRLPSELPVVVLDSSERTDYPVVDTDQAQGASQATQHLLDLGHPTVWHVAGPSRSYSAVHRESAWREALVRAGAPIPEVLRGDWTAASGDAAGRQLAGRGDVTAVFAANDEMAIGIIHAFRQAGLGVPADVSVVGFDDIPGSDFLIPPLTTIRQDFDAVGREAIALLIDQIEGRQTNNDTHFVPTELVVRASTAPVRDRPFGGPR